MRYPELIKIVNDRLRIKSTHYRKKRIKSKEIDDFFKKKHKNLDKAYETYVQEVDKVIKEYFDENTNH